MTATTADQRRGERELRRCQNRAAAFARRLAQAHGPQTRLVAAWNFVWAVASNLDPVEVDQVADQIADIAHDWNRPRAERNG